MLHLSKNQFSPELFTPIGYEYSLSLFTELNWIDVIWQNNLTQHQLLAKVSGDGELVMVMSEGSVFINKDIDV